MVGVGYGKTILFGEHFVVYGCPAIASSINLRIKAEAREAEKTNVLIDGKEFPPENVLWVKNALEAISKKINVENKKFFLNVDESEVPVSAGLGSSAAFSVAVTRALNELYKLELSDEQVNDAAYAAETSFHGTPSGIDNSVSTFNTLIRFERNLSGGKNKIEPFDIDGSIDLIIVNSGEKEGSTKELVANVREWKGKNEARFKELVEEEKKIIENALNALKKRDLKKLGEMMNRNHEMLRELGVSTKILEEICEKAKKSGALGAKLTGAGGGGCVIALAENEKKQENIIAAFKNDKYKVFKVKIGARK